MANNTKQAQQQPRQDPTPAPEAQAKKPPFKKKDRDPRYKPSELEQDLLLEAKYFDLVLIDGEKISPARLLGFGMYHLHIDTEAGRLLVPKHAIKYFVLEKYGD